MPKLTTLLAGAAIGGGIGYLAHDEIEKNVGYGEYLIPHKYYVYQAARELGLPWAQAAKHDLSKFGPTEWPAYANWFNGPKGIQGTKDPETFAKFRKAVQHHYAHNPHHWRALHLHPNEVPINIKMESVADWWGVTKAKNPKAPTFKNWFEQHRETLPIDNATKDEIEMRLHKHAQTYTIHELAQHNGPMVRGVSKAFHLTPDEQVRAGKRATTIRSDQNNWGRGTKFVGREILPKRFGELAVPKKKKK